MYIFDLQRQEDIDYTVGNWYVSTHPESSFAKQLMVARTGEGWRRTLNNGSFAIHRMGHDSERRQVTDLQALLNLLESEFGILVPEHETLVRTLERLIAPQ